jgi:hypothetical protein
VSSKRSSRRRSRPLSKTLRVLRLQLVHLYTERRSPKFEKAALRWLERYLTKGSPRLQHFTEITASLAKREPTDS